MLSRIVCQAAHSMVLLYGIGNSVVFGYGVISTEWYWFQTDGVKVKFFGSILG